MWSNNKSGVFLLVDELRKADQHVDSHKANPLLIAITKASMVCGRTFGAMITTTHMNSGSTNRMSGGFHCGVPRERMPSPSLELKPLAMKKIFDTLPCW